METESDLHSHKHSLFLCHVKTHQEGGHLPARKRVSPGTDSASALTLNFSAFRTVRINSFCEGKNYTQLFFCCFFLKTRKLRLSEIS